MTILGSGTSTGVPLLCCKCPVCRSKDPKNKRLRASAWLQTRGKSILIDTSTDLRQQALANKIPRVDAVLYTHPHADHIHGIDELRSFNFAQKTSIPIFGNEWTYQDLTRKFEYIFNSKLPVEGGGIPQLHLTQFSSATPQVDVVGVPVQPIPVQHGSKECIAYRFDSVAYVTDCSYIPETSLDRLKGLSVLVLDCVKIEPHKTHLNLDRALEMVEKIRPKKTFLTHLGHDFDYAKTNRKLPKGVKLAYDGLKIRVGA